MAEQHKHIFISYRSIEAEFAFKIAADLRNAGIAIWLDRLDGIRGADDWRRSIEQGLRDAEALIAVLSPDYINSTYCMRELATADDLNIVMIPILIRDIPVDERPIEIRRLQYVDFQHWRDAGSYSQKLKELLDVVQQKALSQIGEIPDVETRYLNRLISELESRRGVLEYVDLSGETEIVETRPKPYGDVDDEFGFSELISKKDKSELNETLKLGNIRDALKKHSRFVLVGDAGSSKTTTIRRLALEAAHKRLINPIAPLPLLLYLPRWESEDTPQEFIRTQWRALELPTHIDPIELLKSGVIFLYLDGLNEIGGQGSDKAKALGDWLKSVDAPQYVIVTCRKHNYVGDFEFEIPVVQIEPMSDEHIQQFVRNYIPDKAGNLLKRILPQDDQSKLDERHLYHLARNPYMLAALIVVFDTSLDKELPRNHGKLVEMLVQALAKREERRFSRGWLPLDDRFSAIKEALANLAFAMIDKGMGTKVSENFAKKFLSKTTLESARSANYIEANNGEINFHHQLMQEYFASLCMHNQRTRILRFVRPPLAVNGQDVSSGVNNYSKWKNAIANYIELSDDKSYMRDIAKINPFFAAEIVASGEVIISDVIIDEIVNVSFEAAVLFSHNRNFRVPLTALSMLGEQGLQSLAKGLHHELYPVREVAAGAIGEIVSSASFNHQKYDNRWSMWNNIYNDLLDLKMEEYLLHKPNQAIVALLVDALSDISQSVRHAAALSLIQCVWKPENTNDKISFYIAIRNWQYCILFGRDAIPRLAETLLDDDPEIRRHAAQTISELKYRLEQEFDWRDYISITSEDISQKNKLFLSTDQEIAYHIELGHYQKVATIGANGIPFLISKLSDGDNSGRTMPLGSIDTGYVAAKALAALGTVALPDLVRAVKSKNKIQRSNASISLVLMGEVGAKELFLLLSDDSWSVRQISVWALGEGIRTYGLDIIYIKPKLLQMLNDKSPNVKGAALRSLMSIIDEADMRVVQKCLWDRRKFTPEIYYYLTIGYLGSERVCDLAAKTLTRIGTKQALISVKKWKSIDQYLSYPQRIYKRIQYWFYGAERITIDFNPNQE